MEFSQRMRGSLDTLLQNLGALDDKQSAEVIDEIRAADRIYIAAAGRSLLMMRAFAMRLMHLGKTVFVVGDTVTPAARAGDLLLMASGSGETSTLVAVAKKAVSHQMRLVLFTTYPQSTLGAMADAVMFLPGKAKPRENNMKQGQPGGNIFEHMLLTAADCIILQIAELDHIDITQFRLHANLE